MGTDILCVIPCDPIPIMQHKLCQPKCCANCIGCAPLPNATDVDFRRCRLARRVLTGAGEKIGVTGCLPPGGGYCLFEVMVAVHAMPPLSVLNRDPTAVRRIRIGAAMPKFLSLLTLFSKFFAVFAAVSGFFSEPQQHTLDIISNKNSFVVHPKYDTGTFLL